MSGSMDLSNGLFSTYVSPRSEVDGLDRVLFAAENALSTSGWFFSDEDLRLTGHHIVVVDNNALVHDAIEYLKRRYYASGIDRKRRAFYRQMCIPSLAEP
jgi:hypothetical protein